MLKHSITPRQSDSNPNPDLLISRLANVRPAGPNRWRATCPAHGTGRNQALSIAVKGDKLLLHCFAGCPSEQVLEALGLEWRELYAGGSRPWDVPGYYRPNPAPPEPEAELRQRWERWWSGGTPSHPLLRRYLQARGLSIEPPPSLRLAYWEAGPTMLARVTDPNGELCGIHMTLLARDGSARLSKRLAKGSHPLGGAIRLYPLEPDKPLALAEGIETALAVHEATGWPVWACVSAGGLERVVLPPEALEVVVAADNDKAGLEAANRLARRLLGEGRRVRIAKPPKPGADWLDVVAGEVA